MRVGTGGEPQTSEQSATIARLWVEIQPLASSVYELVMNICHAPAWTIHSDDTHVDIKNSGMVSDSFTVVLSCRFPSANINRVYSYWLRTNSTLAYSQALA